MHGKILYLSILIFFNCSNVMDKNENKNQKNKQEQTNDFQEGVNKAKADIEKEIIQYLEYGELPPPMPCRDTAAKQMNFTFKHVLGCAVQESDIQYVNGYNGEVEKYLIKNHGEFWRKKLNQLELECKERKK